MVLCGNAEIGYIHQIPTSSTAHKKVLGFDIPMNNVLGMNELETTKELVGKH